MNKILSLTKVLFKNAFLNNSEKSKPRNTLIIIIIVGILMIGSYGLPLVMATKELVNWLSPVITPSILLEMFVPSIVMMLFIFSVITIISYYYLSTDITLLLPMPLKPYEILLARFILVTVSLYFFEFLFFGPFMVGYGIGVGANVLYYIYAFIFLLTAPLVPVSIMSIFITSLMRVGNFSANKDRFTYIVLFLSLGLGIGISMLPNIIGFDMDPSNFANIVTEVGKVTNYILPYLRPVITALKDSSNILGVLWFLLYLALSTGVVYLFLLISSKVYIKGVMVGGNEKMNKKHQKIDVDKSIKSGSAFKSYALKDVRLIIRTPVYNTNLVLVEFIMVIIMAASFIFGASADGGDINALIKQVMSFRINSQLSYIIFIFLGGLLFFNGVSLISASSISREGKSAYFMKYIPMSPLKQINAKISFGVIMHLLIPVVILIGALALGVIDFMQFMYFLVPSVLITIFMNYWGILVDLARPKLNWDNETVAVKQNFNGVIYMLICYALGFAFGGIGGALAFIDPIREFAGQVLIASIATFVGLGLSIISTVVLFLYVNKTKSINKWMILLNVFTLFIILGGILIFAGIMEYANFLFHINAGIGLWSLVISIVVAVATYILVKSISLKGDAIFDKIN